MATAKGPSGPDGAAASPPTGHRATDEEWHALTARCRALPPAANSYLIGDFETIKPEAHIMRFVEGALGRAVTPEAAVSLVRAAAREIGLQAYELDWRIRENQ